MWNLQRTIFIWIRRYWQIFKSALVYLCILVHSINYLLKVLTLKLNFQKTKGKLRSLWKVNFVLTSLSILTLVFDKAVLYGNVALSIVILSSKKSFDSLFLKSLVFQKICFKVKVMKTFKIFSDCHVKKCRSLKQRTILKIPSAVF